jgi:ribosomal protein L11 methyltransferase
MGNHVQVTFSDIQPEQQEWVIAHLAEAGYEGFEEGEHSLKAFIPEESYDRYYLKELAFKYQLDYSEDNIPAQNWNAIWESSFLPVVVEDYVAVRADFHEPVKGVRHEILITPKMSFGTGHHATTYMMMHEMQSIDFLNKLVFDFGTGTGVLAILAEKSGAREVIAIDNDEWSISNAGENIRRNECRKILLSRSDTIPEGWSFDIILANINRNVLLENMTMLASRLAVGGILLLSGILVQDEAAMVEAASASKLEIAGKMEKDNWICIKFVY